MMSPMRIRTLPSAGFGVLLIAAAFASASESGDKAKADLAKRLDIKPEEVTLVREEPVTWPDGALGLRKEGQFVTESRVPGSVVTLNAKGTDYFYTTGGPAIRFGGPTQLRSSSLLHLSPRRTIRI